MTLRVEHFEVLGIDTHGDRAVRERARYRVASAVHREGGVGIDHTHIVLVHSDTLVGKLDEKWLLSEPGLVDDTARRAVHTQVAPPGRLIKPEPATHIEVVP